MLKQEAIRSSNCKLRTSHPDSADGFKSEKNQYCDGASLGSFGEAEHESVKTVAESSNYQQVPAEVGRLIKLRQV